MPAFVRRFFNPFHKVAAPLAAPLELARHGVPFYVSGPFDNPTRVIRTLISSVGEGNFHYIAHIGAAASW